MIRMRRHRTGASVLATLALAAALPLLAGGAPTTHADDEVAVTVIRARWVLPMTGGPIEHGVVIIRNGVIDEIGTNLDVPEGATVIDLGEGTVLPGLVDARATYGMSGGWNEQSNEVTDDLRVTDALDTHDPAFQRAVRTGVTAAYVPPGGANVVGGVGAVVKTAGENRLLAEAVAVQVTLGREPCRGNRTPRSGRPINFYYRRPTNRMGVTSIIRRALFEAGKDKANPEVQGLSAGLRGDRPLRLTARHFSDVKSALKLSGDFGFPLVIDDAGEAYTLAEEIAAAGVPVVLRVNTNTHGTGRGHLEGGEVALDAARQLHEAGVKLALATWSDPGHAGPMDAASLAHRFGLPREAALAAVTSEAAAILGVEDRIGTLERGKDADLVAFDGDPLQPTSRVVLVVVNGEVQMQAPPAPERPEADPATPAEIPTPADTTPTEAPKR